MTIPGVSTTVVASATAPLFAARRIDRRVLAPVVPVIAVGFEHYPRFDVWTVFVARPALLLHARALDADALAPGSRFARADPDVLAPLAAEAIVVARRWTRKESPVNVAQRHF